MEQKKELKRNKAIQITAIIMLIIAAIAIVLMLPVNTITANAAAENLIKNEITINAIPNNLIFEQVGYSLNLKNNKKYNLLITVNETYYNVTGTTIIKEGTIVLANSNNTEELIDIDGIVQIGAYDKMGIPEGEPYPQPDQYNSVFFAKNPSAESTIVIKSVTEFIEPIKSKDIISNVTGGFINFLTGTGEGIANFFEAIFTDSEGNISIMAIVFLSLMGLGLASGVIRILLNRF